LARALALASEALADAPAGLLTDFDGTLSPIAEDPALATLVDGASGALAVLTERLAVVAVVTGRAARDARRMTGVPGLLIAGNHGTEWLEPDADEPIAAPEASSVRARLDAALAGLPELPGVSIEHKGLSATVHFRNAPDPEVAGMRVRDALEAAAVPGVELRPGRMSLEVRPLGAGDKGTAVASLVERHGLRGLVVIGDDVTDLDMFRAAHRARDDGVVVAVIGVGGGGEVPPEVAAGADALLPDPAAVVELLRGLAGG
jgi:trehalose 6-phosphate phosphatase